jgi:hypothetical protein
MHWLIFFVFVFTLNFNFVQAAIDNKFSLKSRKKIERADKRNRCSSQHGDRIQRNRFMVSKSCQFDAESDEFLLDTTIFYVPALEDQYMSSVAFDGTNYLVVWVDERRGYYDICAARVSKDGVVLDPAGIFISSGSEEAYYPSVAFDGTNYFVVWEEARNDIYNICGARVNQAGIILDPNGIVITSNEIGEFYPSLASDGVNYLVVWENEVDCHIYGARVSQAGIVLDPASIPLSAAASYQSNPAVAFDGTNYLVVWEDWGVNERSDIYGVRVSPAGIVIDSIGIAISTAENEQIFPSIAFDGDNYLIVWEDYRHPDYTEIYGARVSPEGVLLDTGGIAIATSNYDHTPSIAFDGINYFVVWYMETGGEFYHVDGIRINKMGIVLDPQRKFIMFLSADLYDEGVPPAIAYDGINYLVAGERESDDDFDIYGAWVSSSGDVLDEEGFVISTAGNDQGNSCIAFDGENYLVVWQDERNIYNHEIYAVRVNQYGIVLDQVGSKIIGAYQGHPAVAFDRQNYFVVWGTSEISGARLSQSGSTLESFCFWVSGGYPSVAFDGTNYLVVWRAHYSGSHYDIIGRRVNQDGVMVDSNNIIISNADDDQEYPKVAFDGTNYLVVWDDERNDNSKIYGARVSPAGVVLDSAGFAISKLDDSQTRPSVAFDGTNYLVIWREGNYIGGTRASKAGDILDKNYIKISNYSANYPVLTFDGSNYIVVWRENRRGNGYDIYGAKIDTSGAVIDTFRVSENLSNNSSPAIACGLENQVLITWSGWTEEINGRSIYTDRIWAKFYPQSNPWAAMRPQILPNTPNPFNDLTTIKYLVYQNGLISIKIYDIKGKKVRDLFTGDSRRGSYTINWNGTDNQRTKLPQGIYICQIKTSSGKTDSRKFIFLK